MTKKPETTIQPGVTASGVPLSQLDTTGYDGSSQSAEAIAASLARIDAMPLTPEMLAGDDEEEGENIEGGLSVSADSRASDGMPKCMNTKPENTLQPGVTGKGVPLSQLDTTGYDFGGSMSEEDI